MCSKHPSEVSARLTPKIVFKDEVGDFGDNVNTFTLRLEIICKSNDFFFSVERA